MATVGNYAILFRVIGEAVRFELVFATCSVLREEGEGIAEQFLAAHPEFSQLACAGILAAQHIALDTGAYLRLFPHRHHTDGFFAAAFERKG